MHQDDADIDHKLKTQTEFFLGNMINKITKFNDLFKNSRQPKFMDPFKRRQSDDQELDFSRPKHK